jgi:plasmid maintenance system antidote protein VapI
MPRRVSERLRDLIAERGLTVTEAAAQLNIGRPALSNVLRGVSALSPRLAIRVQRTFNANARELLIQQLDEVLEHVTMADDGEWAEHLEE